MICINSWKRLIQTRGRKVAYFIKEVARPVSFLWYRSRGPRPIELVVVGRDRVFPKVAPVSATSVHTPRAFIPCGNLLIRVRNFPLTPALLFSCRHIKEETRGTAFFFVKAPGNVQKCISLRGEMAV